MRNVVLIQLTTFFLGFGASQLYQHYNNKPNQAPKENTTDIVASMEDCINGHSSTVPNDAELNRLYRQCWNHAHVKVR